MYCLFCKYTDSEVIETRLVEDGACVRRRRNCPKCSKRFTTYERIEEIPVLVVKRDGKREPFDRVKLREGIVKGLGKSRVTAAQVDEIVRTIAIEVTEVDDGEIESAAIGEMVTDRLLDIDKIAYMRFASVFKRFEDVSDFKRELKRIAEKG